MLAAMFLLVTGASGAGKSTVRRAVAPKLLASPRARRPSNACGRRPDARAAVMTAVDPDPTTARNVPGRVV
jgi:type II secretory pathway predicted ATPase ExeA